MLLLIRYLIEHGAHVGAVNSEGELPLDVATEDAMERLLKEEIRKQGEKPACLARSTLLRWSNICVVSLCIRCCQMYLVNPRLKFVLFCACPPSDFQE